MAGSDQLGHFRVAIFFCYHYQGESQTLQPWSTKPQFTTPRILIAKRTRKQDIGPLPRRNGHVRYGDEPILPSSRCTFMPS